MTADFEDRYDIISAAAWILGHARNTGIPVLPVTIRHKKAFECSAEELERIIDEGLAAGLKLYPFKKSTQLLQRTRRVLGFLHSVSFGTMLDVGSGRG